MTLAFQTTLSVARTAGAESAPSKGRSERLEERVFPTEEPARRAKPGWQPWDGVDKEAKATELSSVSRETACHYWGLLHTWFPLDLLDPKGSVSSAPTAWIPIPEPQLGSSSHHCRLPTSLSAPGLVWTDLVMRTQAQPPQAQSPAHGTHQLVELQVPRGRLNCQQAETPFVPTTTTTTCKYAPLWGAQDRAQLSQNPLSCQRHTVSQKAVLMAMLG